MTHHPHLHCIVPGGGLSLDGDTWGASRNNFLVSVKVLSALFRGLFLDKLLALYAEQRLHFFAKLEPLAHPRAFKRLIVRLRRRKWYVDARPPFAGPKAVLAYLSRYTHRVAIANSRLISVDEHHVTFKWKDYRAKQHNRYKTMTLETPEFMRRFLIHVLPTGFHRIRHYGLFANAQRRDNIHKARALLHVETLNDHNNDEEDPAPECLLCPDCGAVMRIIERFEAGHTPAPPPHRGGDPP